MKQLTVKMLRATIKGLSGDTVVFIGDDEELNGVHAAYFAQTEDLNDIPAGYEGEIGRMLKDQCRQDLTNQNVLLIS